MKKTTTTVSPKETATKHAKIRIAKIKELSDVEKLTKELAELDGKISHLKEDLHTEGFQDKVGVAQFALMCNQYEAMVPYRDIVAARLKLIK